MPKGKLRPTHPFQPPSLYELCTKKKEKERTWCTSLALVLSITPKSCIPNIVNDFTVFQKWKELLHV